tara:strand:- start:2740 stop:3108 length:369 start_codon:yes stop_codon:yes gene_type:complete
VSRFAERGLDIADPVLVLISLRVFRFSPAVERGVDVRVLTDAHKAKKRKYEKLNVLKAHMPDKKGHMHHKFLVIDGEEVVTGSFNFVTKSLSGNYENVIAIKSPAMAASFTNHWNSVVKATR